MVKEKKYTNTGRAVCVRIASMLLALMFAVMFTSPGFVFAEDEKTQEQPLREVHRVGIGNDVYCFFVQHNVVLTPEEIADKTDEELISYILEKAGLYMKEANCRLAKHKAIAAKDWPEKKGILFLSINDIDSIRAAEPVDGAPVKMYMDLLISKDPPETDKDKDKEDEDAPENTDTEQTGDSEETPDAQENADDHEDADDEEESEEKEELYSTYKKISPELIFVAIATPTDAASGEDICKEEKTDNGGKGKNKQKIRNSDIGSSDPSDEEMLPELRTINMVDRSGDPIEETLKDGSPVTLEWIEPEHSGYEGESSFTDRFPGGVAGLIAMISVAAAAVIAAVIAAKKKKEE